MALPVTVPLIISVLPLYAPDGLCPTITDPRKQDTSIARKDERNDSSLVLNE
jgi:hypothetical protein